ncbi:MAG: GGDEF domain-containing protein [Lachnospiraceae bacterium]|nr:GGDEF domain-containing protein [Lachnospiraceae bacterium]
MDVADENETKKASVIMRCTSIVLFVFFAIQVFVLFFRGYPRGAIISMVCLLGYLAAFCMTYQGYTAITQHFIEILTLGWVAAFVAIMGWDCSYQHMIFSLMLFSILTSYQTVLYKALFASFICIFRILLYFYIHTHPSFYTVDHGTLHLLNILNTFFTFLLFFIISVLFSKDSMQMEEKLVKYNKKIEKLAKTDALTKLPNRRDALERIEKHLKRSKDPDFYLDIAIGDIDFFKNVNDTHGHEAGDAVLVQMANIIKEHMGEDGFVARWGGEEFLFVYTHMNGDEAALRLNDLRTKISQTVFKYNTIEMKLTMTFGLQEYDFHNSIDDVINSADEKLYYGKTQGRNQVVF